MTLQITPPGAEQGIRDHDPDSETTCAAVKDEFECRPMPDARLRGKAGELKFYEVVSVRASGFV